MIPKSSPWRFRRAALPCTRPGYGTAPATTPPTTPRQAVVAHCTPSTARFHPTNTTHVYARYRRHADTSMDESFFPILWTRDGYRTPWLNDYVARGGSD